MAQSYQVIARRWRPKQFTEVVGQDHIVRTLTNAIEQDRIAHAYLFVGPRGTGKTSTARLFAKALNADGGPNINPDNESELAKSIMAGTCMDVIEIDGASNNSVEQVRSLREECQYAPAQAKYKIYIIDEVHMLSTAAFNALLKTLEEPPPHVKFIFATTEAHKVLPTIVSRCQRFEFRPISDSLLVERLQEIADAEGIQIDKPALHAVARLARGGMRDAQSTLDQLIAFCGKTISEQNVLDVYGLASEADIESLCKGLIQADYSGLISILDKWETEGRDFYRALGALQERLRNELIKIVRSKEGSSFGESTSAESLMRMLEALAQGETLIKSGLSERVNFEVALLRAAEVGRSRAIDSLIKDLSALAAGLPQEAGQKKIESTPKTVSAAPLQEEPPVVEDERWAGISDDTIPADEPDSQNIRIEVPKQEVQRQEVITTSNDALLKLPEDIRQSVQKLYRPKASREVDVDSSDWI